MKSWREEAREKDEEIERVRLFRVKSIRCKMGWRRRS